MRPDNSHMDINSILTLVIAAGVLALLGVIVYSMRKQLGFAVLSCYKSLRHNTA